MSSRCSFVNVNIGIPACGVVAFRRRLQGRQISALARSGSDPVQPRSRDMARKSVEPTRALVSVANRLGANVAGRNRKREKRQEAERRI